MSRRAGRWNGKSGTPTSTIAKPISSGVGIVMSISQGVVVVGPSSRLRASSTTEELEQGPGRRLDGWGSHEAHLCVRGNYFLVQTMSRGLREEQLEPHGFFFTDSRSFCQNSFFLLRYSLFSSHTFIISTFFTVR
jgi:hypothetical protein